MTIEDSETGGRNDENTAKAGGEVPRCGMCERSGEISDIRETRSVSCRDHRALPSQLYFYFGRSARQAHQADITRLQNAIETEISRLRNISIQHVRSMELLRYRERFGVDSLVERDTL